MSKTIHLSLDVLECFVRRGHALRLTEIVAEIGQPKATVYRAVSALEDRGYLSRLADERYRLGVRCLELGSVTGDMLDLRAVARAHIEKLNAQTQETVHLALYERGDVVYVDKVDSPLPVAPKSSIGTRAPSTAISTGRVLLAFQSAAEIDRVLAEPLDGFTANSVTDVKDMRELLEDVRTNDLATNEGSWREGVSGIAAPLRDHTGIVVASIGCCIPSQRFTAEHRPEIEQAVRDTASAISTELGYRVPGQHQAS